MYFKEKEDTNIDSEFESKKSFGFNFNFSNLNLKSILLIVGGIILLAIIIFVIVSITNKSSKYTIVLYGDERITIALGNDYIEPGYYAHDKKRNDITKEVKITNNINISKVGEYEITYSINDIKKVRYVIVTDKITETYIHLKGQKEMCLEVGEKYIEPGYEVYNSLGENLTSKVKVTGKVDTSKIGTYELRYTVVNSKNITIETKRRITIVAKK